MAMVSEGMPCALCGEPIPDPTKDTFAMTMHGFKDRRFVVLDDSACHQRCIDQWELREEFIDYFNQLHGNELFVNRRGHVVYRYDYKNALFLLSIFAFGFTFLLPSIVFSELFVSSRMRSLAFALPFIALTIGFTYCSLHWSYVVAAKVSIAAWALASVASCFMARYIPMDH